MHDQSRTTISPSGDLTMTDAAARATLCQMAEQFDQFTIPELETLIRVARKRAKSNGVRQNRRTTLTKIVIPALMGAKKRLEEGVLA